MATVSGFFGFLAVVLAILGIYGVLAYTVAQRTNEIGIRMALGASRFRVLRMIIGEAAWLVGIGLFLGAMLSILAARLTERLLFGIQLSILIHQSEIRNRVGRRQHAPRGDRFRTWQHDHLRLRTHHQALEARYPALHGDDRVRGAGQPCQRVRVQHE